jgi:hypothetical protein
MNKLSSLRAAVVTALLALAALAPAAVVLSQGEAQAAVTPDPIRRLPVLEMPEIVIIGGEEPQHVIDAVPVPRPIAAPSARRIVVEPAEIQVCRKHRLEQQTGAERYPGDLSTASGLVTVCE